MKLSKTAFTILLFLCASFVNAQDQAEMMKRWQDSMTPGEMHQLLAKSVGKWNTEIIMTDPSGKETSSMGSVVFELLLGGRYLKSTHSSSMMGMPFEGIGIDAYDNVEKKFVSIWIDNQGTGIIRMKGDLDEASKTLTFLGEGIDVMSGLPMKYKSVTQMVNDNKAIYDMYSVQDNKEVKMFRMIYTR